MQNLKKLLRETTTLTVPLFFDTHHHGREGTMLQWIMKYLPRYCWGAIFEPNLEKPITTCAQGVSYRDKIMAASSNPDFVPYILAYFTDSLDPDELWRGIEEGIFIGLKLYPRGATTNSRKGIVDIRKLWTRGTRQYETLRAIGAAWKDGMPVTAQLHGQLNFPIGVLSAQQWRDPREIDPYEKGPYFIREVMPRLLDAHPDVPFSLEHIATNADVRFMQKHGGEFLTCSATAHHALIDRRDVYRGGYHPNMSCLPPVDAEKHLRAIQKFILSLAACLKPGSDSALHLKKNKHSHKSACGIATVNALMEWYLTAFDAMGATVGQFLTFMGNGARPLRIPEPKNIPTLRFRRKEWTIGSPASLSDHPEDVIWPFGYDPSPKERISLLWQLAE